MPNINKVVFGNQTLIDLSTTTLSAASQLQNGITAYDRAGNVITGTASGGGSGGIVYQDAEGYIHLSEDAANVISIVDELDTAGGTIRTITGATGGGGYTVDEIASREEPSGAITITLSGALEAYVLYGSGNITTVTAQNLTQLKTSVFEWCAGMTTANFPNVTSVGDSCFSDCRALKSISIPNVTSIPSRCFYDCYALENIDFGNVTSVGANAFRNASLKDCTFNPVTVNDSSFRDGKYFDITYFPRLTTINGTYTFAGTYDPAQYSSVSYFVAPLLTTIQNGYALSYNDSLAAIDIGNLTTIPSNTMRDNYNFETLVLRKNGLTTLANIDAFRDTPFASGGSGGTLYVPNDLISTYESATNWSTILAYTNNQIKSIESTHTDPNAPIDLTVYYADGTPIPTT